MRGEIRIYKFWRDKICATSKNEQTNYVWFPIIADEKQWALAMPNAYLHKSLKIPSKLRTKIWYRISIAEILACIPRMVTCIHPPHGS